MTATQILSPSIVVAGSPLLASWLDAMTSMRIDRGLGLVGRATMQFVDEGYALASSNTLELGAKVSFKADDGDELMRGIVTGVNIEHSTTDLPQLTVVAHEATYKLTRNSQSRSFTELSYSDIIKKLASEIGLSSQVDAGTGSVPPYILQNGTDFAFLDGLVERAGLVWWLDADTLHAQARGTSTATVTRTMGVDLREYSVNATGLRPSKVVVGGWDIKNQADLVGSQAEGSNTFIPDATIFSKFKSSGSALGAGVFTMAATSPADATDATTQAKSIMNELAAGSLVARGTCFGSADLKPAVTLTIADAGPASGSYLLTHVEHIYDRRGFETRFTAGAYRPTGLVDSLGGGARVDGGGLSFANLTVGVVTDVNDPDKLGAVKIKFGGLGGGTDVGSSWARLLTAGAGANRGVVFQPEINDEVLVGFENGDTRRPVVLGGLFSAKNTLPNWAVADSKVSARRITSRDGHFIELSDGSDDTKKHVLFQLISGHLLRLGADKFDIEVASGKPVTIKAGDASFQITAQGDVVIEANNITLKAKQKVDLEGLEITANAQSKASVQGAQVEVKGSATAEVSASGQLALKGGMVQIN